MYNPRSLETVLDGFGVKELVRDWHGGGPKCREAGRQVWRALKSTFYSKEQKVKRLGLMKPSTEVQTELDSSQTTNKKQLNQTWTKGTCSDKQGTKYKQVDETTRNTWTRDNGLEGADWLTQEIGMKSTGEPNNLMSETLAGTSEGRIFWPDDITSGITRPSGCTLSLSKFATVYVVHRGYVRRSHGRHRRTQPANRISRILKPRAVKSGQKWYHAAEKRGQKCGLRKSQPVNLDTATDRETQGKHDT